MEIKKVSLCYIRSYKEASVELPEGSVLFSGDIGSGKSSVLLAVEFALFGLQKGSLSGASLLRNGEDNGKVKLDLNLDGKNVEIERSLKRGSKGVTQDSCCITIDGERKELSTMELKQHILKLLNYPQEFLNKNPILYRYTIYTPQEEMKQILLENPDERLNTLRRVFAVDKYKRIIENTSKFIQKLRESIRNKEGQIVDVEEKKQIIVDRKKESEGISQQLSNIIPLLEKATSLFNERKKEIEENEEKLSEFNKIKTEFAVITETISSKTSQLSAIKEDILEAGKEIKSLSGENPEKIKELLNNAAKQIYEKNYLIKRLNQSAIDSNKQIASIETKKSSLEKLQKEVAELDNCPTCRQKVSPTHKNEVIEKTRLELESLDRELRSFLKIKNQTFNDLLKTEEDLQELQKKEKKLSKADISFSNLEKKKKEFETLSKGIMLANKKQAEIKSNLEQFKGIAEKHSKARNNLDEARDKQEEIKVKKTEISTNLSNLNNIIKELEGEIIKKEKMKTTIQEHIKIRDWLSEQFIPVLGVIEKNVLATLHLEFNSFFENWFDILTASEALNARLDESFTPVIEQAGYEMDYAHLSGGERTAAALAYRLALNQVINSLISNIKTRDILILDEPTDGFSSEQLDKMRDVFKDINAKQLILVSHESKIENFVDNIIRFEKQEHVSRII